MEFEFTARAWVRGHLPEENSSQGFRGLGFRFKGFGVQQLRIEQFLVELTSSTSNNTHPENPKTIRKYKVSLNPKAQTLRPKLQGPNPEAQTLSIKP